MFKTLLVANRGEIALRVVRAGRELGVRSIAVYSEADRGAPHVLEADEAHLLGPAPAQESYLSIDRILEVARTASADAVHPGYGFLAERADFARAVEDAGLAFVGPRPQTIERMGDKAEARRVMESAGVRVVPGSTRSITSADEARSLASELGFPVLIKAVAGGGGRGMRLVENESGVERAFEAAAREAWAAFGDGSLYLERRMDRPRHVEIQILGDERGTVIHLGDRECSIQRRHQKLLEEAPSPGLTAEEQAAMGETAVRAAEAVGYRGAGTVEFLYEAGEFHFLEMNTRIQVEHPVTEMVTGVDLVEWQLRIAAGEPLAITQGEVEVRGHAIECRINAEDPTRGFLPSAGRIEHLELPTGAGVRWDGGVATGSYVGLHYDSLLGKLVVHAADRQRAIRRMSRALDELIIAGVDTSAAFHQGVMEEPDFRAGFLSTRYVEEHPELERRVGEDLILAAAAAGALLEDEQRSELRALPTVDERVGSGLSAWRRAGWPWRPGR